MAVSVQAISGGILGLLDLIEEYGEAIEYDLIGLGLRLRDLGTERLTWQDFLMITKHTPRQSALARAVVGEKAEWGSSEHLLASILDALHMGNWQRSGAKSRKPKPIPRPGVEAKNTQKIGSDPIPAKDFNDWWENG